MNATSVPVGIDSITVTNLDFLNGYQEGHLAYMVSRSDALSTDARLTELFLEKLESTKYSSLYSMGFVVGWLATLAKKGVQP